MAEPVPVKWAPRTWPRGPFTPPPGAKRDLVVVEQYALLALQVKNALQEQGVAHGMAARNAGESAARVSALVNGSEWVSFSVLAQIVASLGLQLSVRPWPRPSRSAEEGRSGEFSPRRSQWPRTVAQPVWVNDLYARMRGVPLVWVRDLAHGRELAAQERADRGEDGPAVR